MIKVALYARYSSDMQRTESISAQVRACKMFCNQKDFEIVKVYADEAQTGRTDQRAQFQQMIQDSAQGLFDIVLVHKLDRFSRDPADSLYYSKTLKKNGVELISVTESFDGTPEGEMMKMVIMGMNQYYVLNLARETKKGQLENAHQCLSTGGNGPLGYDVVDKRFVVNQTGAEAVRLIFSMYDAGKGYMTILDKLNELGYQTKRGQPFAKNSLYEILRNPKYCGRYVYNRSCGPDHSGKRSPHRHKSLDEQVIIEDGVPAIVNKELWQRVQDRLDKNKRLGGSFKAKQEYLLSGKIRCGLCEGAYHGNFRRPDPQREYHSYRCCNRDVKKGGCQNREIKKQDIERFVLEQIEKYFFNDALIPTLTKGLNDYIRENSKNSVVEKARYQSRLKELTKNRENIISAIAQSGYAEVFGEKLKELESEIARAEVHLSLLERKPIDLVVTPEMVRAYFAKFREFTQMGESTELKQVIQSYVDVVEIYPQHITVKFKVAFDFSEDKNNIEYCFEQSIDRSSLKVS